MQIVSENSSIGNFPKCLNYLLNYLLINNVSQFKMHDLKIQRNTKGEIILAIEIYQKTIILRQVNGKNFSIKKDWKISQRLIMVDEAIKIKYGKG